jgi:arylsulfatase
MKLTRRNFIKTSAALTCATAGFTESYPAAAEEKSKINVLLIHADQHRMECLGAYGNPDVRTPHIDALAADGVRYENSFCPYPVCTPSRYSLLSGQYVHQHRGWNNHCTLAPEIPTFPRLLRDAGYTTEAIGKMHFAPTYLDVGFDKMTLAEQDGPGRWDDDYHRELMAAGLVDVNDLEDQRQEYRKHARPEYWKTFGALPSNLPEEWHTTSWVGERAITAVNNWKSGGNLLMAGFVKPHHPFDPPASHYDRYNPDRLTLLPGWTNTCLERDLKQHRGYFPNEDLSEKALRRVMACYYATIEHIDEQVGRMVEALKRNGQYDNTMIIYTSDHGEYLGFHHMLLKGNLLYDPLIKVPLIIKYPAAEATGQQTSKALVNNIDLAPTILHQAGITPANSMIGNNLAGSDEGPDMVFCEVWRNKLAMARTRTKKLILSHATDDVFLFDLEKDPLEIENYADDPAYGEDRASLTESIAKWRSPDLEFKVHLDENAPVIKQPNVPPQDNSHREDIIAWYDAKMKEALSI